MASKSCSAQAPSSNHRHMYLSLENLGKFLWFSLRNCSSQRNRDNFRKFKESEKRNKILKTIETKNIKSLKNHKKIVRFCFFVRFSKSCFLFRSFVLYDFLIDIVRIFIFEYRDICEIGSNIQGHIFFMGFTIRVRMFNIRIYLLLFPTFNHSFFLYICVCVQVMSDCWLNGFIQFWRTFIVVFHFSC